MRRNIKFTFVGWVGWRQIRRWDGRQIQLQSAHMSSIWTHTGSNIAACDVTGSNIAANGAIGSNIAAAPKATAAAFALEIREIGREPELRGEGAGTWMGVDLVVAEEEGEDEKNNEERTGENGAGRGGGGGCGRVRWFGIACILKSSGIILASARRSIWSRMYLAVSVNSGKALIVAGGEDARGRGGCKCDIAAILIKPSATQRDLLARVLCRHAAFVLSVMLAIGLRGHVPALLSSRRAHRTSGRGAGYVGGCRRRVGWQPA